MEIDVEESPNLRRAIFEYSEWPMTPQLFIDGKFIGGSHMLMEMHQSHELQDLLRASDSTLSIRDR